MEVIVIRKSASGGYCQRTICTQDSPHPSFATLNVPSPNSERGMRGEVKCYDPHGVRHSQVGYRDFKCTY